MAIKKGDIIKVSYEGRLEDGKIFDSTELNNGVPLKFEVGANQVINGFEKAVIGKKVGDEFSITLQPSEAYGEKNPSLRHKISKKQFPNEAKIEVGMFLKIETTDGNNALARITNIDEDSVTIDMNHPLAGKTLNFKIKIVETGCEPNISDSCGCGCEHH